MNFIDTEESTYLDKYHKMPKRGSKSRYNNYNNTNGSNRGGKFPNEHDDRLTSKESGRRVSFKPSKDRNGQKNRKYELSVRTHLEEEDIDMGTQSTQVRFNSFRGGSRGNRGRRGNGRNSPGPRGGLPVPRKLIPSPSGWYQVIIPHGQHYEKDVIIKSFMHKISPTPFNPLYFKTTHNSAFFYVEDFKLAEKLLACDRRIKMQDGHNMLVKVITSVPQVNIDTALLERMKLTMAKRFNPATKALDLSNFHNDPELTDIYCSLARPTIMLGAIDIIASNIPELEALNLDQNKIQLVDHLKCLTSKLPNIKILYMANNKITHASSLEHLKGLPLVELVTSGNPFRTKYKDNSLYVR